MRVLFGLLCLLVACPSTCRAQQPNPLGHVKLANGFLKQPRPGQFRLLPKTEIAESRACGHILVAPTSPRSDPGMIVPLPRDSASRMPIVKSLPVCPDDVRLPIRPAR